MRAPRWLRINAVGLAAALVLVVSLVWFSGRYSAAADARRRDEARAAETRQRLERLASDIKAQTQLLVECTAEPPAGQHYECRDRGRAQQRQAIIAIVIEGDCRARRLAAKLGPPDPSRPCADQTPAAVWPPEANPKEAS